MQLGRLELAEQVLSAALEQAALAPGQSFRRRAAVLTDLATVGMKRGDAEQVAAYAGEALRLARQSNSGYVTRRLQALRTDLQSMTGDPRIRELRNEMNVLNIVS